MPGMDRKCESQGLHFVLSPGDETEAGALTWALLLNWFMCFYVSQMHLPAGPISPLQYSCAYTCHPPKGHAYIATATSSPLPTAPIGLLLKLHDA
jgi:hypothetical protein